jgi:hypothetical protein
VLRTTWAALLAWTALALAPGVASAALLRLSWDAPPAAQWVVAWRIYRRDPGGAWAYLRRVTAPAATVEAGPGRCWQIAAVNVLGQVSPRSEWCGP